MYLTVTLSSFSRKSCSICVLVLEVIQLLWGLHLNLGNTQFKKRIANYKYKTSNKTESLFKVTKDIYHTGKSAAKSHKHEI